MIDLSSVRNKADAQSAILEDIILRVLNARSQGAGAMLETARDAIASYAEHHVEGAPCILAPQNPILGALGKALRIFLEQPSTKDEELLFLIRQAVEVHMIALSYAEDNAHGLPRQQFIKSQALQLAAAQEGISVRGISPGMASAYLAKLRSDRSVG